MEKNRKQTKITYVKTSRVNKYMCSFGTSTFINFKLVIVVWKKMVLVEKKVLLEPI